MLLEFNSGSSPWDLVMSGRRPHADYGRHFERWSPGSRAQASNFAVDDIVPVFAKVMLRYQGKLVSMPYDGDIHIMYWNKVPSIAPTTRRSSRRSTTTTSLRPRPGKQWDEAAEFFHGWGWTEATEALGAGRVL